MPTDPTGSHVRNAVATRRFQNQVAAEIDTLLTRAFRRIERLVIEFDPTAVFPGNRQRRVAALDRRVGEVLDETYSEIHRLTKGQAVGFAQVQERFAAAQLARSITSLDITIRTRRLGAQFWRAVVTEDPIQGAPLRAWWATQKRATRFAFRRQIQLGLTNGEPVQDIVRRVRGRAIGHGRFEGGVLQTSTREATTLVRTAVNQISNRALEETYTANKDITEEYRYVATLDSRTSEICASLDGKVFRYDDPSAPRPPQHHNCRSVIVPIVKWKALGVDPPDEGMRASKDGPVPADQTYGQWLRNQPGAVQDEILGPARAKLFRAGKVGLDDLVRTDGSRLTLDELERKIT